MTQPDASTYTWLSGDSLSVAPLLLGWEIVSDIGPTTAGRIIEVEAYHGTTDPASHAYRGETPRTGPMFDVGGTLYVYLSHGIHNCMNIVTGPKGDGQAVLIRALLPTRGMGTMSTRRHTSDLAKLCNGPGNLTQALGIDRSVSGTRLGGNISLRPPSSPIAQDKIIASPRVGISKAKDFLWRFRLKA